MRIFYGQHYQSRYPRLMSWLIYRAIDLRERVELRGRAGRGRGLILAGGTATRLGALSRVTNKHLLPVYDRPMIFYPIETMRGMGIREVMIILGGRSIGDIVELLADGSEFGLDLTYRYQSGAAGIAHAIGLARDFVADDSFCVVLGDNILRGPDLSDVAAEFDAGPWGAGTFSTGCPTRSALA